MSMNPGSDEAIKAGCVCPVLDNGHGRGYMGQDGVFVMSGDCHLHGFTAGFVGCGWRRFK